MPLQVPAPVVTTPQVNTGGWAHTKRTFTIGDVTMSSGGGTVDDAGLRWVLTNVTGWENTPASTASPTARIGDHGSWVGPAYLSPRTITVDGSIGADWETANDAIDQLMAAVPISGLAVATFGGAGVDKQALVQQGGELLRDSNQNASKFSLPLFAPDPRRYSSELVTSPDTAIPSTTGGFTLPVKLPLKIGAVISSGQIVAVNDGNIDTPPVFTVTGPCPAFTITHRESQRSLTVLSPVDAGRTLVLDCDKRTAVLDGTAPRAVTGSWFTYAPGTNTVFFTANASATAARLRSAHRHAWK